MYRGIIGSLLYLTASRPDIVINVGLCTRFQSSPEESHVNAAKRILRYLKGTLDRVLYYPSRDNFDLIGYADADYLGDIKSTSGMAHFLGSCLISWIQRNKTLWLFQLQKLSRHTWKLQSKQATNDIAFWQKDEAHI
ncbi:secreted RxLR effector protein 161-like [Nicotiana tabacum]|uniref:Secreted RxLR effector protein 161-like n=1 Tax=Nicotiana tabacum TaxID=4097 RepID=A0AC58RUY4_TOBAC